MWEVPGKPLCIRMEPLQQRTRGAREWQQQDPSEADDGSMEGDAMKWDMDM